MATCEELQKRLSDAEDAWHQLQMGGAQIRVRYGDKEVEYSRANESGLARYILTLRSQVAACTGVADSGVRRIIHVIPVG